MRDLVCTLGGMTEYATSEDGTQIAFDRIGDGPHVMIYVAGATQHRAGDTFTLRVAELLGAEFTTLTFDRRGRGESGDTLPYSIDREIDDIAALVAEAGGSAMLFGHSSGAVLALDAVARDIGISKAALYEAPLMTESGAPPAEDGYLISLTKRLADGDRGGAVELFMQLTGMPNEAITGMREGPWWPALEAVAPTLAYDGTVMADAQSQPWGVHWAAITIPILVMNGDQSHAIMGPAAEKLSAVLPNAKHVVLAGQTHEPRPEVLAPLLADFFRD
ncbi:MAG: alpha/beta hydrolase [Glaciihabitans sp.]|nr:alpha/beta hydrolase [Glaciihabitans sp.]